MNLVLAYYPIPHHAGASGYHQLARVLEQREGAARLVVERVPPLPVGIRKRLIASAGLEWYEEWAVALEATALRRLLRHARSTCHFLYGEDSFAHLARLRPLLRLRKARLVATYHQPPEIFERVCSRPSLLRSLDAVIAVSTSQADYLRERTGSDNVFVVPHGIDTGFYSPEAEARPPRGEVRCLFVGSWLRDVETLARVARSLTTAAPNVRFDVISDAEGLPDLPNTTIRAGLSDREFLAAYRDADLLVLPLLASTANNCLLEALACGLPVVTTAVGGVTDYVDDACAVTVGRGDSDAMSTAIIELAADEERRAVMGRNARRRALELDWQRVADRTLDVYRQVQ